MRGRNETPLFCHLLTHFAQQLPNWRCRRPVRATCHIAHIHMFASPLQHRRAWWNCPKRLEGALPHLHSSEQLGTWLTGSFPPLSSLLNSALPSTLLPSPALRRGTASKNRQAAGVLLIISHFHRICTLGHLYNCNSVHTRAHTYTHIKKCFYLSFFFIFFLTI